MNLSDIVHVILTEVVGFVLQYADADTRSWMLILSMDLSLADGPCGRGPFGVNITMTLSNINVNSINTVKGAATLAVLRLKFVDMPITSNITSHQVLTSLILFEWDLS